MSTEAKTFTYVGTRPIRHDGADKVTGRANYGADINLPGMLHGVVVRSPHAHARIVSIDTAEALKLCRASRRSSPATDLPETSAKLAMGEGALDLHDIGDNLLAHKKALYHGHAVAAVAATSLDIAREAAARVRVEYEVLAPVLTIDQAISPGAPILHRRDGDARPRRRPERADQRRRPDGVAARRSGTRICRSRHRGRARVPHADGPSGLHRAACLRRALGAGRPRRGLDDDPGTVRGARRQRGDPRHRCRDDQGDPHRDRRRVRRQDHRVSRTAGARAVAEDEPPGEDGDDARRGVPRDGSDLWHEGSREDRREVRRDARRRHRVSVVRRRRLSRLAVGCRRDVLPRVLPHSQLLHRSQRRRRQQAEGRGVSRARIADGGVRDRIGHRRDRAHARDGSDRAAAQECSRRRRRGTVRAQVRADRIEGRCSRRPGVTRTGRRRSDPIRDAGLPAASGSTPA